MTESVKTDDLLIACRTGQFGVEEWSVETAQTVEGVLAERAILLCLAGRGRFLCGERNVTVVADGCLVACPGDCCFHLAADEPMHVLAVRMSGVTFSRSAIWSRAADAPNDGVVSMTPIVRAYAEGLRDALRAGVQDDTFIRLKACELLCLLRVSYPDLVSTCRVSEDVRDAEFVRMVERYWKKVRNKAELAAAMGMSASHLGVRFRESFGVPPYRWLTERRCEAILHRLIYGKESFRQIGAEFHFRSAQHFNDFCKKHFGTTPGDVRRRGGSVTEWTEILAQNSEAAGR